MLEEKIAELRKTLIGYAIFVEKMIDESIQGLLKNDRALLLKIIEKSEKKANETEILIDDMCTTIIAQFGPKAKVLRIVLMSLKINNDLERIADHAVNTAESGLFLITQPLVKPLLDIPRMAKATIDMLQDAVSAFVNEDPDLAVSVCDRDQIVDDLASQILRELITYMISDTTTIERSLHLLKIARNLERTADLSTNISEDVIYMIEGKVVKHQQD
ncbi:MAG: phosphate signaling complex protein PhoU [Thermodesulfobacteriota bacterium]